MTDSARPAASDGPRSDRAWLLATVAVLLAYAGIALLTFSDYGITYDEAWQARHGENVVAWYSSGFTDRSFEQDFNLRFYGGLFDSIAALLHPLSGMDLYQLRHLLNAVFAWLCVAGVARLAWRLGGARAAFFAALILVVTPRFCGHGFNNCKDIPFTACFVWALDALTHTLPGKDACLGRVPDNPLSEPADVAAWLREGRHVSSLIADDPWGPRLSRRRATGRGNENGCRGAPDYRFRRVALGKDGLIGQPPGPRFRQVADARHPLSLAPDGGSDPRNPP